MSPKKNNRQKEKNKKEESLGQKKSLETPRVKKNKEIDQQKKSDNKRKADPRKRTNKFQMVPKEIKLETLQLKKSHPLKKVELRETHSEVDKCIQRKLWKHKTVLEMNNLL